MACRLIIGAALGAALIHNSPAAAQHREHIEIPDGQTRYLEVAHGSSGFLGCGGHDPQQMSSNSRFACRGESTYADGEWALYNNRTWEPGSYNDWWHDRPDRAFPRWVQEQRARGTCDRSRVWWSGSGWHC